PNHSVPKPFVNVVERLAEALSPLSLRFPEAELSRLILSLKPSGRHSAQAHASRLSVLVVDRNATEKLERRRPDDVAIRRRIRKRSPPGHELEIGVLDLEHHRARPQSGAAQARGHAICLGKEQRFQLLGAPAVALERLFVTDRYRRARAHHRARI